MKTSLLLPPAALAAALLLLAGCIPSVHPFFTARDIVRDPRLPGAWQCEDERWTFTNAEEDDGACVLVVEETKKGKRSELTARLFRLDDSLFLDLQPRELDLRGQHDLAVVSMIAGHLLLRVHALGDTLEVSFCNYEWLGKYLSAHPAELAHRTDRRGHSDDASVITAETPALQAFVRAHLAEGELFERRSQAKRFVRGAAPGPSS
jgi:hypothetical protein